MPRPALKRNVDIQHITFSHRELDTLGDCSSKFCADSSLFDRGGNINLVVTWDCLR